MPRFYCPIALSADAQLDLPAGAARHVQVLRLQPGAVIELFTGAGGQWQAQILEMGRSHVHVRVLEHTALDRELHRPIHLLAAITANERMDWLEEKARYLGCGALTLDSGVQRHGAHRFYFREGLHVSAYSFKKVLK